MPILVVEDDAAARALLVVLLESEGYEVVTATNGMQALAAAREHRPWLILLDLMMPVMGGEAFLRAQRAADDLRRIPVVVLSGHPETPRIATRLNAAVWIEKPVEADRLLTICAGLAAYYARHRHHWLEPPS
jgi:CheY-like chemotaxis protein